MSRPTKETDAAKLKPCPFCNGRFIPNHPKMLGLGEYTSFPKLEELTEGGWRVCCYGCGVQTWDNLGYTREQAIEAWNTRPTLERQRELAEALEECKARFQAYATHHAVAGKDEKAEVNRRMVRRCEQALATKEGVV